MKKILTLTLVLIIIIATTACGKTATENADPYTMYAESNKKIENAKSMELETTGNVKMSIAGQKIDMKITSDIKMINHSENDVDMQILMTTDMGELGGGTNTITMYFNDGVLYQEMLGQKISMNVPLENIQSMSAQSEVFEKNAIKDQKLSKDGANNKIEFTIDGKQMSSLINSMVGEMLKTLQTDTSEMTVDDITAVLIIDKNNTPISMNMKFKIGFDLMGQKVTADYDLDTQYVSIDKIDKIDFPDFSDYTAA